MMLRSACSSSHRISSHQCHTGVQLQRLEPRGDVLSSHLGDLFSKLLQARGWFGPWHVSIDAAAERCRTTIPMCDREVFSFCVCVLNFLFCIVQCREYLCICCVPRSPYYPATGEHAIWRQAIIIRLHQAVPSLASLPCDRALSTLGVPFVTSVKPAVRLGLHPLSLTDDSKTSIGHMIDLTEEPLIQAP